MCFTFKVKTIKNKIGKKEVSPKDTKKSIV